MNLTTDTLHQLEVTARKAGGIIMEIYENAPVSRMKEDSSPVTEADILAEKLILSSIEDQFPEIPVIAEEAVAAGHCPGTDEIPGFFLVDPLDGTKEFLNRNGEFTVNIAYVEDRVPVLGIVYCPAKDILYAGLADTGAWREAEGKREAIRVRSASESGLRAVGSRSHGSAETTAFLDAIGVSDMTAVGSSLKFCVLAEGSADIYPRFGRTMEWDTAAGHAVLNAAGGQCVCPRGSPFLYGKRNQSHDTDFANGHFVAVGDRKILSRFSSAA